MKKNCFALLRMFLFAVLVSVFSVSMISCAPESVEGGDEDTEKVEGGDNDENDDENDDEKPNEGDTPKDTVKVAVTGEVEAVGYTYADVSGYAYFNSLPAGGGKPVVGIEFIPSDAKDDTALSSETISSLMGNYFSVSLCGLAPNTEYKYRAFVTYDGITYRGEYSTFATKEAEDLTSSVDVSGISYTSAVITSKIEVEEIDSKEQIYMGIAYSEKQSDIVEGLAKVHKVSVDKITDGIYTIKLDKLSMGTTYYYASFTEIDETSVFSPVKEFATKVVENITYPGNASNVSFVSAVITSKAHVEKLLYTEEDVYVGIAYSTWEEEVVDGMAEIRRVSVDKVSSDGTYAITLDGLSEGVTYYYTSFTELDGIRVYSSSIKYFTTNTLCPDKNHFHAVDLGLSVKWACCNVGAECPEDYGDYFAWGETETKFDYTKENSATYYLSTSELKSQGIIDSNGNLTATYDAATANWGTPWRMPTLAEINELINECGWSWTTKNGIDGYKITGRNGNSIFLPYAGCSEGGGGFYRSATCGPSGSGYAHTLYFYSSGDHGRDYYDRHLGFSVRPVTE